MRSTTRWTSTGDTGGAATGPASSGSPSTATSSAPPTGRRPRTTPGGPSTRSPAAAPTSRSRSPRATPRSARGRRAAQVSGEAGRRQGPGRGWTDRPCSAGGGPWQSPAPRDSVVRKQEAERRSERGPRLGEQCPERPASRRPFLPAPSRWPLATRLPTGRVGEGCDARAPAAPLSLPGRVRGRAGQRSSGRCSHCCRSWDTVM